MISGQTQVYACVNQFGSAKLRYGTLHPLSKEKSFMANLLKVTLVPDSTTLSSNRSDITVLTMKDIINTNGEGHAISIPLPDQSVAIWHLNQCLETIPSDLSLSDLFNEIDRASVPNARIVIEARHPFHDSFVDDDLCVRAITVNKLKSILAQTNGSWWNFLTQLMLDPEFLPVIKDLAPKQRDFELRTRRNAIHQSRLGIMAKPQNQETQFISCYADVAGVQPFPFTVYRDWKQDQYLSPEIVTTGQWEPQETHLFINLVRGLERNLGDTPLKFFNVGSNIGWYSTLILNASEHAQVTAFEPVSSNFALLQRNVAPHAERASLNNFALSNESGETTFYIDKGNFGGSSFIERPEGYLVKETVQLHYFDELYADADASNLCDFMVMDIEGAEHKFFNGARNLFERGFRPVMMLEYCPSLLKPQGSDGTFIQDLAQWGYQLYIIDRHLGGLSSASPDVFLQHYARLVNSEAYLNYLAVPAQCDLRALLSGSGIRINNTPV